MPTLQALTYFVAGIIMTIILLLYLVRLMRHKRPQSKSGINSIMEAPETIVAVINPKQGS